MSELRKRRFGAISDAQIDHQLQRYPSWGCCLCNDQIRSVPRDTRRCYIINLQNSWQPGSHWVLLSCLERTIYYWDPFGALPTQAVHNWVRSTQRPALYCNIDLQSFDSEACGYYCMYIAARLMRGDSPTQIMHAFRAAGPDHERLLRLAFTTRFGGT